MATVCGVTVHTWGTSYGSGQGLFFNIKNILFGGNHGHASLTLTIPQTEYSKELIKKYCEKQDGTNLIPCEAKTIRHADGHEEQVYVIFFSWYMGNPFYLAEDISYDRKLGIPGSNFKWSDKAREIFKPVARTHRGVLSSSTRYPPPFSIAHTRELEDKEKDFLLSEAEINSLEFTYLSLNKLMQKIDTSLKANKPKLKPSEQNLFQHFLGHPVPAKPSKEQLAEYKSQVTALQEKIKDKKNSLSEITKQKNDFHANLDDYLTLGNVESGLVSIPIKQIPGSDAGRANGLDAERMLHTIHEIITVDPNFTAHKNCSETVGRILESGVQQPHLKAYAASRLFGTLGAPQLVYNTALRLNAGIIRNEQSNFWHRFINYHPIDLAVGRLLKRALSPVRGSVLAAVALIIILPIALILEAIFWPFLKFAEYLGNKYSIKSPKVEIVENEESADCQDLDNKIHELLNPKIKEIDNDDPIAAILEFAKALAANTDDIPVFSVHTRTKLIDFLDEDRIVPNNIKAIIALSTSVFSAIKSDSLLELVDGLQLLSHQRTLKIKPEINRVIQEHRHSLQFSIQSSETDISTPGNGKTNSPKL